MGNVARGRWMPAANVSEGGRVRAMRAMRYFAVGLVALFGAVVAPGAAEPTEYTFGTGDQLRITVFGHEDLSGEFTVNETGAVALPLAGSLALGGLTIRQSEQAIVDALKPDYLINPRVSVEILNYRPFYIIGEVKAPGSYPYVNGITVTEAVALGGGFTYRARKDKMVIIRASDPAREERSVSATEVVMPGDVIEVLERFF